MSPPKSPSPVLAPADAVDPGARAAPAPNPSAPGAAATTASSALSTPPPAPAKPVLASILLSNLLRQHHQHHARQHGMGTGSRRRTRSGNEDGVGSVGRVKSGFGELDDYVLLGGVERGAVVGISGDGDNGAGEGGGGVGRLVALNLLTTVLMSNSYAKATVIDTTGSFPVSLLAKIIHSRTASQIGQAQDERVQEVLGRVAISRVFDIEGIWEVTSEISADCQSPILARDHLDLAGKGAEDRELTSSQETVGTGAARNTGPALKVGGGSEKELEIGDSEAEEEDIDIDDDLEKVDSFPTGNSQSTRDSIDGLQSTGISLPRKDEPALKAKPLESREKTEIIIIDNMTTPISELFARRERNFAHTFLTAFSRTLHTVSQTHNILTFLLNTLTYPLPCSQHPSSRALPTKPISVFTSTAARPALGRLFTDLLALHLLVTSVPKTTKDAAVLYASPESPDTSPRTPPQDPRRLQETAPDIQYAHVIEVLKDTTSDLDTWLTLNSDRSTLSNQREGSRTRPHRTRPGSASRVREHKLNRTHRWAPFVISADGLALHNAFPIAPTPMSALGQMHIVKQFPFGRRV